MLKQIILFISVKYIWTFHPNVLTICQLLVLVVWTAYLYNKGIILISTLKKNE